MAELKNLKCINNKGNYVKLSVDFTASSTTEKAYYRIQCKLISLDQSEEYDFLSLAGGALVTANSTYTFNIECSNLTPGTTYECYCYVDYRGVNETTWTSTDVGTQMRFTTLGESAIEYSLWGLEAGEDYIEFYISIDPSPEDIDIHYEYDVFLKSDSEDDYWKYDFIGHDITPNITEPIKLLYGIEPGTTYNIYVNIWYIGGEMALVGTTPIYTITTATPDGPQPAVEILSIKRTSDHFSMVVKNIGSAALYYSANWASTYLDDEGDSIDAVIIQAGKTFTFEQDITGENQYHPLFVCINHTYDNGSEWYYPTTSNPIVVQNKKYNVRKNTKLSDVSVYFIKVDVEESAPWDAQYEAETLPSDNEAEFMWAPYTENNDAYIKPTEHNNIWVSTNYNLHNTSSTMIVKLDLRYICDVSFKYLVCSQYLETETDDFLTIYFDDTKKNAFNVDNENKWKTFSIKDCSVGEHTLKLVFSKNASVNKYRDCACFADFQITPCLPVAWDWNISNYNASDIKTKAAYRAITNGGPTTDFSHLVWNDMVNKVKHILDYNYGDYLGGAWNTEYNCDYRDTLMEDTEQGRRLTAQRYNSLRDNVDDLLNTGIDKVISMTTPVSGQIHFINLMDKVNEYIKTL